jgi:hypothetical protein
MFTNIFSTKMTTVVMAAVMITAVFFMGQATGASAASYAYVDVAGDVKSVTANDWKTAIAIAPNIHFHSGVMLLVTAADFTIVGDSVVGY